MSTESELPPLHLGALVIPHHDDLEVHVDLDIESGKPVAVRAKIFDSEIHLAAFAAPQNESLWNTQMNDIRAKLEGQGVACDFEPGRFGIELHAVLPTTDIEGNGVLAPVRFLGLDGERWFLRVLVTGAAAIDEVIRNQVDAFIADVQVNRGPEAMGIGEPLELKMPEV